MPDEIEEFPFPSKTTETEISVSFVFRLKLALRIRKIGTQARLFGGQVSSLIENAQNLGEFQEKESHFFFFVSREILIGTIKRDFTANLFL